VRELDDVAVVDGDHDLAEPQAREGRVDQLYLFGIG
jgi:hypothetical protein